MGWTIQLHENDSRKPFSDQQIFRYGQPARVNVSQDSIKVIVSK